MAASARYFDLVREMKNPYNHRLRLVESVRERGIKPTARLFAASTLTVRKWWRRYQQLGPSGLQEHSRAPHRHPLKTSAEIEQQVLALRQKLPTFGAARLKREFDLPVSHMAMPHLRIRKCSQRGKALLAPPGCWCSRTRRENVECLL